tara:strand:- start:926 stop:1831 length:906 start_codon:yes stop_codon:yes gene_type:complete
MSDEANNPAEPELALETESPAPEAENIEVEETQAVEEASDDAEQTVASEEEAGEPDEGSQFVSVEYDGQEYEVPPQLKDALLRQSDYTQKTQSLAEQRKSVEAQAAALQQQAELQQQTIEDVAAVKAIDQQIEQYNALNWDELYQQDVGQASALDRQKRELESQRQNTINRLNENQAKALANQRAEHARIVEEGQKVLKKEIDNWTPELAQTIAAYGISQGLKEQAVASITDPVHVKLIDKARRYDELVAKQKAAMPKAEPPKSAVKVKGKRASATKDPDKMSIEEWTKMRNKQVEKRRSA